jgi:hypothetical protein
MGPPKFWVTRHPSRGRPGGPSTKKTWIGPEPPTQPESPRRCPGKGDTLSLTEALDQATAAVKELRRNGSQVSTLDILKRAALKAEALPLAS